jgi:perosamine synthetase
MVALSTVEFPVATRSPDLSAASDPSMKAAFRGGLATFPEGPPGWPIADEDIRVALERAWRDGDWGRYHGAYCRRLEQALAALHAASDAPAPLNIAPCCSGTFAVELALRGLGVSAGDEVLLAAYDFQANFRSIEAIGAVPVLLDVDADHWNLDPTLVAVAVGPKTRAILVSHLHGGVVPMREVMEQAARHRLRVVEDACQCPGATIDGRRAGTWGDAGVISFGGSKLLTAGRGGAVITRDDNAAQRMKLFCERGNHAFPLSELQAAVLLPQLEKLDARNAARAAAVERLLGQLMDPRAPRPLVNRPTAALTRPGYYKLGFQFTPGDGPIASRDEFSTAARAEGIALDAGFRGFTHRSERRCRRPMPLPNAERAAANMLVLHHPILLEAHDTIDRLAAGIRKLAIHS